MDSQQQSQNEKRPEQPPAASPSEPNNPNGVHRAILDSASGQAVVQIITIWHDRLQLISVFSSFFTGIDTALLSLSNSLKDHTSASGRVMDATLSGALIFHAAAAILAYIASFVLIRYKLNETAHHIIRKGTSGDSATTVTNTIFRALQTTLPQPGLNPNYGLNPNSGLNSPTTAPRERQGRHAADPSSAESQSGHGHGDYRVQVQGHRARPSTSTERAPLNANSFGTRTSTDTYRPDSPFLLNSLFSPSARTTQRGHASQGGLASLQTGPDSVTGTSKANGAAMNTGVGTVSGMSLNLPPSITHPADVLQAVQQEIQKGFGLGVFVSRAHPFSFGFKGPSLVTLFTCGLRPGHHARGGTSSTDRGIPDGDGDGDGPGIGEGHGGEGPDEDWDQQGLMRLLTRCHSACSAFILVGFLLVMIGVVSFVWINYVRAVSIWTSACVGVVIVVGFAALH